jgi:TRAP-type C4-dicarboxylate transport system substrate-binding protein
MFSTLSFQSKSAFLKKTHETTSLDTHARIKIEAENIIGDKDMKPNRWVVVVIILYLWAPAAPAKNLPLMRISVENSDTHVQTTAVKRFADELAQKLQGRIDVQFFSNARLYRDKDIVQALGQGKVEMAVPGTWHIARFEPNVGIFLLPIFYGKPASANYTVLEGDVGKAINDRIEKRLQLKVVGRWIDLGHAHLFSMQKKIARHKDIEEMVVRVAGGVANKLRIEVFGGYPTVISWPDLPEYMRQGRVEAILTSYETVRSAKLWEKGIRYAFEDREYFPQYIPLVRMSFWRKCPPDVQQILTRTWEKHVDAARADAARAQSKAKQILIQNGVEIVVADAKEIETWRKRMLARIDDFISKMGVDAELVKRINHALWER